MYFALQQLICISFLKSDIAIYKLYYYKKKKFLSCFLVKCEETLLGTIQIILDTFCLFSSNCEVI